MTDVPIACTLTASDMTERLASFADLNRGALRATRQTGLMLELDYDVSAADRVRELVRLEQTCCAFLRFEVEARSGLVRLRIIAPPEAAVAAEAMFAQFGARGAFETPAREDSAV